MGLAAGLALGVVVGAIATTLAIIDPKPVELARQISATQLPASAE